MLENETEITMSVFKANMLSFCVAFLLSFFLMIIHPITFLDTVSFLLFVPAILFGIVLHEYIHAVYYKKVAKIRNVKYGISFANKVIPTPYVSFKDPISVSHHRLGLLLPTLMICGISLTIAVIFTSSFWFVFSFAMFVGGLGDLIVLFLIKNLSGKEMIKDHPTKIGVILERSCL